MKFEEILTIVTFVTGLILLLDVFVLKPKRVLRQTAAKQEPGTTYKLAKLGEPMLVEYARAFFPVLLLVLVLRSFVAEPFRIPSGSMKPTLLVGDFILVNKFNYGLRLPVIGTKLLTLGKPARGDVIVFRHPNHKDLIKRVVGLPGDHIVYRDKVLHINDRPVELIDGKPDHDDNTPVFYQREILDSKTHDIYTYPHVNRDYYPVNDVVVPDNSYFVMGDNRDSSEDSRFWGFVNDKQIIGQASATWLSWDWRGWSDISVRWNRIFKRIV